MAPCRVDRVLASSQMSWGTRSWVGEPHKKTAPAYAFARRLGLFTSLDLDRTVPARPGTIGHRSTIAVNSLMQPAEQARRLTVFWAIAPAHPDRLGADFARQRWHEPCTVNDVHSEGVTSVDLGHSRERMAFLGGSRELAASCLNGPAYPSSAISRAERNDGVPGIQAPNLKTVGAAFEIHGIELSIRPA